MYQSALVSRPMRLLNVEFLLMDMRRNATGKLYVDVYTRFHAIKTRVHDNWFGWDSARVACAARFGVSHRSDTR